MRAICKYFSDVAKKNLKIRFEIENLSKIIISRTQKLVEIRSRHSYVLISDICLIMHAYSFPCF